jgi:hypothetical protein
LLLAAAAQAEPPPTNCEGDDVLVIRDAGPGRAIVVFLNHAAQCSRPSSTVLRSPAGIEVFVEITVGGRVDDFKERIEVRPLDGQLIAIPPEAAALDGETVLIVVQGGLS